MVKILRTFCFAYTLLLSGIADAQCPVPASCTPGNASSSQVAVFNSGIFQVNFGSISRSSFGYQEGYRDRCSDSTNILIGTPISISITTGSVVDENVRVWIDYNNDGNFNTTTELAFSSNAKKSHTGTVTAPSSAVLNTPLRMRIAADAFTAPTPTPCSTPLFSQTEDYVVRILPNNNPPIAAFSSPNQFTCTGQVQFTDESTNPVNAWQWNFGDGNTSNLPNPSHIYTSKGIYDVTLIVTGPGGSDTITKSNFINFTTDQPTAPSCQPATSAYCCGYGIREFRFGQIVNLSGNGSEGYQDFSCQRQDTITEGIPFSIRVKLGSINENVKLYLDYNGNGTFTPDEELFSFTNDTLYDVSFTLPAGLAVYDSLLRLRAVSDFVGATITACGSPTNGQVEDYGIVVRQNVSPPTANFSTQIVGQGCALTIDFQDSSTNGPSSWKWYFGDGDSSTAQNPQHTYATGGNYTVQLVSSNLYGSDTFSRAITVVAPVTPASCTPLTNLVNANGGVFRVILEEIDYASTGSSEGYQDLTCSQIANLKTDSTYRISINLGNFFQNAVAYIDFNNDGILDVAEEIARITGENGLKNRTFSVPNTATTDVPLRLRVLANLQNVGSPNACGRFGNTINFGQAEDYSVIITEVLTKPTADFSASDTVSCFNTISFEDLSVSNPTSYKWFFGDGDSSSVASPTHIYQDTGRYDITLIACNALGCDTILRPNYITITDTLTMTPASCTPDIGSGCPGAGRGVLRVALNTINNSSPGGFMAGFEDFTCSQTTDLFAGATYEMEVDVSTSFNEFVNAYIDYNDDGIFNPNELIFDTLGLGRLKQTFQVPLSATTGKWLRMRVLNDDASFFLPSPCSDRICGQVEEYRIRILPPSPTPITNFRVSDTVSCTGLIEFRSLSSGTITSTKWEFGNGDTSTSPTVVYQYPLPGTYTVSLINCNSFGCDTLTKVNEITITDTIGVKPARCTPISQAPNFNAGIFEITVDSFSNVSGNSTEGYQDFTCQGLIVFEEGKTKTITYRVGSGFDEKISAWLDFNNNGSFEANERLFLDSIVTDTNTVTVDITQPGLVTNEPIRLRFVSDLTFSFVNLAPCNDPFFGQTEDYVAIIRKPTSNRSFLQGQEARFKIYPNPTSESITIESNVHDLAKIHITDLTGRTIETMEVGDGAKSIQHSFSSKGIYLIRLENQEGYLSAPKKVVVTE